MSKEVIEALGWERDAGTGKLEVPDSRNRNRNPDLYGPWMVPPEMQEEFDSIPVHSLPLEIAKITQVTVTTAPHMLAFLKDIKLPYLSKRMEMGI